MAAGALNFNADDPPERSELHASRQKLKDILDPSYWQQLAPQLHVTDPGFVTAAPTIQLQESRLEDLSQQLNHAGVAQVAPEELPWHINHAQLAAAVVMLLRHGWPPSMLLVYDEVWAMVQQASHLMQQATGGNKCNMDILCWYVDPSRGDAGFSPHRDRQPDDSPATFRPDGSAMYATLWTPLTQATPENSCLYVIPRFADPGYFDGDPEDEGAPDPLTAALHNKEAYQHIRALPAAPGAAVIFTHRTIHWGSKGRHGHPTPRISISWGCADDAYEPPYFSRQHLPCPPLALRLGLIGAQMIIYHERFPAPAKQLALYYQAFTAQADQFDRSYRSKVVHEFVAASKEATAAAGPGAGAPVAAAAAGRKGATAAEPLAVASSKQGKKAAKKGKAAGGGEQQNAAAGSQAAAAADCGGANAAADSQTHKASKQRKRKNSGEAAAAAESWQAAAPSSKKQKQQQRQKASKAAAAALPAAASSDDEEEGKVDWIAKAAKAAAAVAKASQLGKKRSRKAAGSKTSAAAAAAQQDDHFGSDEGDDVLDMALESMLDAQLAGEEFADDFVDD